MELEVVYSVPPGAVFGDDAQFLLTCMAQDVRVRQYREVSAIISYTYNDKVTVKQFELDCTSANTWMGRAGSVLDVPDSFDYTGVSVRTDCSSCNNTAGNDNHCEACNSACNTGSMRCTGPGPDDCCPVFNAIGLSCAMSCNPSQTAGEVTDYICTRRHCTLPSNGEIEAILQSLFSDSLFPATLTAGPYYTCQSQGIESGTYNELAMIVEVTQTGVPSVNHLVISCAGTTNREWISVISRNFGVGKTIDNFTVAELRTDCSGCGGFAVDPSDNPCYACDSECTNTEGLRRCVPTGGCCVAFEAGDGICKTNFDCNTPSFFANEANNFTCSPCQLSSCLDGYIVDNTSCTCIVALADHICVANNPCSHSGLCILDTAPDQYTCNCTGTGYTGTNCTQANECTMTCPRGYVVNNCMCVLDDICVADNPCSNGGTCVTGSSPHQYHCQCVDYFTGVNCTECSLECLNRGSSPDQNCISCDCSTGYTGRSCSECDAGYTTDRNGECTSQQEAAGTDKSSGAENHLLWLRIGLPVVLLAIMILLST